MAIYNGKHCVFEQVGLENSSVVWNASSNTDNDGAYNDWNISNMRNTHLPARLLLLSSALQENLTNTTVQTATNGNNGALISTSDKLFLPAAKEMSSSPSYSRTEENSALTTWSYWVSHTQASDRIKYTPSNVADRYWLRSSQSSSTSSVLVIDENGNFGRFFGASSSFYISLCYAF